MQGSLCVMPFWYHTVVSAITWKSGLKAAKGGIFIPSFWLVSDLFFRPANDKEVFNLQHTSLWNVIEQIFGVCKRRFKLMVAVPEYSLQMQSKIPLALAALHNLIHLVDPDDEADMDGDYEAAAPISPDHLGTHISQGEKDRASTMRDNIARVMWEDYQRQLAEQAEWL